MVARTRKARALMKRTKGAWGRHLLPVYREIDGVQFQLHATKGWRKA